MNLTNRQKRFVEFYLQTWNAAEAARLAGYRGRADVTGARTIAKPWMQDAIRERMKSLQLDTDDVLTRLAEQATTNYADFFLFDVDPDGSVSIAGINWEMFKQRGHLVKKLSYNRRGEPVLEFHDAQTALIQIGKALGVLKENVEQKMTQEELQVHFYLPDNGRMDEPGDG